jgi:transposase
LRWWLRAIAAAKKKNDRIDASKICDCLRCDFLPECYMASTAIRERRRTLRYRNLLVRQMVQMKIKISSLLMEAGVSYMALSVFCRRTTVSRHSRSSACSPSSISELVAGSSRK